LTIFAQNQLSSGGFPDPAVGGHNPSLEVDADDNIVVKAFAGFRYQLGVLPQRWCHNYAFEAHLQDFLDRLDVAQSAAQLGGTSIALAMFWIISIFAIRPLARAVQVDVICTREAPSPAILERHPAGRRKIVSPDCKSP